MSGAPADVAPGPILPASLRRLPLSPAEGWITFGFVVLMVLTVAWSLDDAAWVLGQRDWGDFYAWAAVIATTLGFLGAKAGWPRWIAHTTGAVGAALVLPVMVGSVIAPPGGSPEALYEATAQSVVAAWRDLAILDRASTNETGHFLLAIGAIVWSLGQFAGYAVFGHRRPLDAVIVIGVVLIGNMSISLTGDEQLGYLVIFSVAALCVLARTHAFEEETTWLRRRIGDAGAVRSIYLRGGAVFIALAVFGSLVLTASASSSPLATVWRGFDRTLIQWSQDLQRYLPFGGQTRPIGFGFGRTAPITGQWQSSDQLAATISLPPGHDQDYYWRAVTFDRFEGHAWSWSQPRPVDREAGDRVLGTLADDPTDAYARREVTFTVNVEGPGNFALSPLDPLTVDRPATLQVMGGAGWLGAVEVEERTYTVTAVVPVFGEEDNGLTANRLRFAGTAYPPELLRIYTALPDLAVGTDARRLLGEIRSVVGEDASPYDLAVAIENRLKHGPEFRYREDVRGRCENIPSVAECFARFREGYCLHYATTMAVLLREAGVPARLVEGFLPNERNLETGVETILAGSAHAWVEVWFPGFGWYAFDPTGGGLSQTVTPPDGPRVTPPPSVAPSFGSVGELPRDDEIPPRDGNADPPPGSGGTGGPGQPNAALLVLFAVLLLVGVGALAFVAWQRGPRGEVTADGVWRGIARTASRFGFGPRPQQTVYEYAGALGDVLPANRPELQTVANAKVEVAYGGKHLGDESRRNLREAHRRLRVGLLRLAFRRGDRRLRGRKGP